MKPQLPIHRFSSQTPFFFTPVHNSYSPSTPNPFTTRYGKGGLHASTGIWAASEVWESASSGSSWATVTSRDMPFRLQCSTLLSAPHPQLGPHLRWQPIIIRMSNKTSTSETVGALRAGFGWNLASRQKRPFPGLICNVLNNRPTFLLNFLLDFL